MKKIDRICVCIIIGFSAFGTLGSAVLFFLNIPQSTIGIISAWVGIIGTAASVLLSVIAMIYSNKSSKAAEESLVNITEQYKALCNEITEQSLKSNLGKSSIENIMKKDKGLLE